MMAIQIMVSKKVSAVSRWTPSLYLG